MKNYINETNTFFKIAASLELTPQSRMLYLSLMHKNNSLYWAESFTVSASEIQGLSGLSQSAMQRARKQLAEKGLIIYKNRGSNRAPKYSLPELTDSFVLTILNNTPTNSPNDTPTNTAVNTPTNSPNDTPTNTAVNTPTNSPNDTPNTLIYNTKLNNTKLNNHHDDEAPFELIQKLWGVPTGVTQGALVNWLNEWQSEMICVALNSAYDYGVDKYGIKTYVGKILANWEAKGIDTVEKALDDQKAFKNRHIKSKRSKSNARIEPIPDYLQDGYEPPKKDFGDLPF